MNYHRQHLHDFAKFAAGLVAGDFIAGAWLATTGLLPIDFLGVQFTTEMVWSWLVFDIVLFAVLVHYGWNIGKTPTIKMRSFFLVVGTIFGFVSIAHLARIFMGTDIVIGSWDVPSWLSWAGTAAAAYLCYMSFHLAMAKK